ncbi:hypothetical protein [Parachlamydia sp. AcF125]|uniref:hypothetical protein n=1 Tax=Parachlamydia sp. AcF125 TaxID=2795736 RepID=UPI001BCA36C9|nr:hypothetical protein [Parachlamydia sp. AcF125]MBS4168248.1 hypothetical protein [Parachlamydia sp. AcF125]
MSERFEGPPPAFDPAVAVDAALTKLEEFTAQNAQEPFPHVYHLDPPPFIAGRTHRIKEQVGLLSSCIASIFSEKIRKKHNRIRKEKQDELLNAISILKKHYPYIYKFEQGSPTHQALAQRFFSTIKNFNALIDLNSPHASQKNNGNLWHTIRSYLCRIGGLSVTQEVICNKILLPNRKNFEDESSLKLFSKRFQIRSETSTTHRVSHIFQSKKVFVHQQDTELFWMKALSLLRKENVYFNSVEEELACIKQSPISETLTSKGAKWILEMRQVINPFPGEKYVVVGQFIKPTQGTGRGIPIPNSFSMTSTPTQTGFPHASQYTGWALSEMLIPKCPHRLDLLPTVSLILKNQHETANRLTLEAASLVKAKQIYSLRKKVFEKHLETFLILHESLSLSLLNSLLECELKKRKVKHYFATLKNHPTPFDCLSESYSLLMEQFVTKPYLALQNAWIENGTLVFNSRESAQQILEREIALKSKEVHFQAEKTDTEMEKAVLDFIGVLGPLLAVPSATIILQEFSEIINFAPPCLDTFAQKIQAATYRQALAFQAELQKDSLQNGEEDRIYECLKERLLEDIQLFSAAEPPPHFPIVEELSKYFEWRYVSQKS